MTQVLHLTNGKTIQDKLESADGGVAKLLASNQSNAEILDVVYLSALSRYPAEAERQRLQLLLAEAPESEKRAVIEDLFWSVLTSREFLFQH